MFPPRAESVDSFSLQPHRPDDTTLSASRTPNGNSENAASILAVDSPDIGRSDSGAEVIDAAALAPPALTSRRGFLMNTMVSAASLGTAAVDAAPLPIAALTNPDAGLMNLIDQLWALEPQYKKVQERFNLAEEAYLSRRDQAATAAFSEAEAAYDEAWNVIGEIEHKVFATEARTLAGLKAKGRWYIQFDCDGDLDQIVGQCPSVISLFRELVAGEPSAQVSSGAVSGGSPCPDPIFAAIEAHQESAAAHSRCLDHQGEIEKVVPYDKRRSSGRGIVKTDDPRFIEATEALTDACDRMVDLANALIDTLRHAPCE
jgi:hypothetical protein